MAFCNVDSAFLIGKCRYTRAGICESKALHAFPLRVQQTTRYCEECPSFHSVLPSKFQTYNCQLVSSQARHQERHGMVFPAVCGFYSVVITNGFHIVSLFIPVNIGKCHVDHADKRTGKVAR